MADDDRGHVEFLEFVDARVVDVEVDHDDAVDAALAPPAAVRLDLPVVIVHDLEGEGEGVRGQLALDAADEVHEERLGGQGARGTGDREPDAVGAGAVQRLGGAVGTPADLGGDLLDQRAGLIGDAGRPLRAYETATFDTPARLAMSAMVGLFNNTPG